jgi:hypothetical protein
MIHRNSVTVAFVRTADSGGQTVPSRSAPVA